MDCLCFEVTANQGLIKVTVVNQGLSSWHLNSPDVLKYLGEGSDGCQKLQSQSRPKWTALGALLLGILTPYPQNVIYSVIGIQTVAA